ncbi:PTS sugar transporter subunit IIA [Feifania hominis]|uniref:Ascorbate-specific PTS system EIIA component n=1 Tax=Feifania hominis TaxID=2763660 RepID=A0A926DBA8_9FIRM|nr:PTS sugar transporter subunit IIA [Feifania hominis]MBC8535373.1 PTS sugar transporter subunit IIA [Feifania hominis]
MTSRIFKEMVYAKRHASDWKQAVDLAAEFWFNSGCCEPKYVELIKQQLEESHAYMVIVPGMVLLHARAGYGVHKNSMMLITLDEPVKFNHPDNDPVSTMICFTSYDETTHLENMQQVGQLMLADGFLSGVGEYNTDEELMEFVVGLEEKLQ